MGAVMVRGKLEFPGRLWSHPSSPACHPFWEDPPWGRSLYPWALCRSRGFGGRDSGFQTPPAPRLPGPHPSAPSGSLGVAVRARGAHGDSPAAPPAAGRDHEHPSPRRGPGSGAPSCPPRCVTGKSVISRIYRKLHRQGGAVNVLLHARPLPAPHALSQGISVISQTHHELPM